MEKTKLEIFQESKSFYINQTMGGKNIQNEIHLTFGETSGNTAKVLINRNVAGIIHVANEPKDSECEFILAEIANLFDCNYSTIYKTTNDQNEIALITKNPATSNELVLSMDFIFKKLYEKFTTLGQSQSSIWMQQALQIPNSSQKAPLTESTHLKTLIEMGINAALNAFTIPESQLTEYKTQYLSMVLFDFITNQTRRNAPDYNIIVDKSTKVAALAPISARYFSEVPISTISFNNRYVDRKCLVKTLYQYYYDYIKEFSRCVCEHQGSYLKSICLIAKNNTCPNQADIIIELIKDNLKFISNLEAEKSGITNETKVDYTQTTIRINQKVMKKNLLIQNKYPDQLPTPPSAIEVNPNETIDEEERIKISIEQPVNQSGFSHVFIITSAVAFISGIAIGIAYILLKLP